MIQIKPHQISPALASMFDLSMPTGIRALAVLAGGNAGKIITDDPTSPHWGFVWEADDGTLYRGGKYVSLRSLPMWVRHFHMLPLLLARWVSLQLWDAATPP